VINRLFANFGALFIQDRGSSLNFSFHNCMSILLLSSMGATALVWGTKELKCLQAWELRTCEQILRSRP
jgi:CHASE2 domain-containing sensor protein